MTAVPDSQPPHDAPSPPTYQLGVYAVVLRGQRALLVDYASGLAGLPGALHTDPHANLEDLLRDAIHRQAGVAVERFELLGSYAFTNAGGTPQLNLVFLTEYVSGLVGAAGGGVRRSEWMSLVEVRWHPRATSLTREAAQRAAEIVQGRGRR